MEGVTISDREAARNLLSFDLIDILNSLGELISEASWELRDLECIGHAADEMYRIADVRSRIDTGELRRLAGAIDQVIDGEFIGRHSDDPNPWIVIRAVDSSAFDVLTDDGEILAALRSRFREVHSIP